MNNLSLIQRFSFISLFAMVIFGFAFGKILGDSMSHHITEKSAHDTADIVNKNVIKHFKPSELTSVKRGNQYKKFSHKIGHLTLGPHILQIKIWNRDMTVVWSDDKDLVGNQFPLYRDLEKALAGEIIYETEEFDEYSPDHNLAQEFQHLGELYVPITYESQGHIDTVFEIYQNLDPLYLSIEEHKRMIWFWTAIGFGALYVVLFGIVWNASRRLEKQTREIRQSKQDWEETFNSITDMITVHDNDFNIIQCNGAAKELLGLPALNGSTKCYTYFHGSDDPPEECAGRQCVRDRVPATVELLEPHLKKYIEIRAIPRKDDKDNIDGLIHVVRDITQRKQDEKIIGTQLNRLSALRSIDKAIIGSMDINVTLDVFLEQVLTHLNIDAASVLMMNKYTPLLEYVVSKGFRSGALKYTKLKLGESNAGRAALDKRIVSIPDLTQHIDGFSSSQSFLDEEFISYFAVPLITKGRVKGVLELFHRSIMDVDEDWMGFLEAIADQGAIAIDNATLFDELQDSNNELVLAYDNTIEGWSRAMDLRDKETEGHTQRVSEMTLFMARELGLREKEIVHIRRGALLHDMGKMGVPDNILLKPGPLTEDEWKIMKLHPVHAYQMLFPIEYLRHAIDIPYYHHERWDGTGYPKGLKGEEIPIAARIFAIVDVWDALRSDRPYRKAWPKEKVTKHILSQSGTHFDPALVRVFLGAVDAMEERVVSYSREGIS